MSLRPKPTSNFLTMKRYFFLLILFGHLPLTAADKVVSIQLPAETATYKEAPGVELARGHCVTCHSADYASSQPPMPRKFWEGAVKKMKEKYGAQIPDNIAALLADYFTAAYGVK